jgi:uracil-DNA glycosylase family 4
MIATKGPATAGIMIIGDCPDDYSDRAGVPFAGPAGTTLDRLLQEAGISRHEVLTTNICRNKPPGGSVDFFFLDGKKHQQPKPIFIQYLKMLEEEIKFYRPTIILALGAFAMKFLTGSYGIKEARGFIQECALVKGPKVLATHHPSMLNYDPKLSFTVVMDFRKAIRHAKTPDFWYTQRELHSSPTLSEFCDYCHELAHDRELVALDIETTSPGAHTTILGVANSENYAMSMEIVRGSNALLNEFEETKFWRAVNAVAEACPVVMQNGLYDSAVLLHNNGILFADYTRDTMVAAHSIWPECPRSLGFLASICLDVPAWKHTSKDSPTLYNAADAANTYGIWTRLDALLDRSGTRNTHDFEMSQAPVSTMLQLQGIYVDREAQATTLRNIYLRGEELDEELFHLIGRRVNLASPKQLSQLLYIEMGMPPQYKRRKHAHEPRKLTTNEEALKKLAMSSENPLFNKIIERKKLSKLKSFVDIPLSPTSRVHTCYNITGANTTSENKGLVIDDESSWKSFGRWSSSASIILPFGSGNLQNIPSAARKMYLAPSGYKYVQADYKQAEAVVVAYLIGDNKLKRLFQDSFGKSAEECEENGWDIHKITADMIFHCGVQNVTKDQRKVGKLVRHATNYSAGPGVLAPKLGISIKQAKLLLDAFHNACPMLGLWHRRIQNELQQTRTLTNLLGRKHRFLDRWGDSLFRSAYAYIPQSTVGDLMNLSLVAMYEKYGRDIAIMLQLHDAIYCLVKDNEIQDCMKAMKDSMIRPIEFAGETFEIDIDFKVGSSWGDLGDAEIEDEDYEDEED